MGTVAAVQVRTASSADDSNADVAVVQEAFSSVESLLNAHDPDSELSRLAPLSEEEALARCSAESRACYAAAFALMEASGGAFNPRWRGPGTLDFGAIAKGYAVDLAADGLAGGVRPDMLVDLGGNVKAVRGAWRTGVKDPNGDGVAAVVELREGEALATSATYYRGSHIYDGRTGAPVTNGVASVTVLCGSAMWADGFSTTLFVLGPEEGRTFLGEKAGGLAGGQKVAALWILGDGRRVSFDPDGRFGE